MFESLSEDKQAAMIQNKSPTWRLFEGEEH